MIIPLVDLKLQYKEIKREIDSTITEVIGSSQFILGEKVHEFEKEFASICGVRYAVGLDSGMSALELGMRALGIGPGDEVITPANSFIASASSISFTGATPVFIDCDEGSYNIDVNKIEKKITKKTKAIMPVHLFGLPANMNEILKIAKKYKLKIIEDACQAHGAKYRGKSTGSFGDFAAFSFYPGKNLGAYGDAGALVTNNKKTFQTVSMMRNYGQKRKYHHKFLAWNRRMDTIQAAILLVKLRHLKKWNTKRQKIADLYRKHLSGVNIKLPQKPIDRTHVYHQFVIRVNNRNKVQKELTNRGVSTGIHYPIPIHLQEAYSSLGHKKGDFPTSEKLAGEILSLPMYPELSEKQIVFIAKSIKEIVS